jgi:iron-sulfur cluster repair protein YtfE (RIC family)
MATEATGTQTQQDTITAFMDAEHTRINEMCEQTVAALHGEQFNALHALAGDFIAALKRHIHAEEQILFPAIEEKSGNIEPTRAMRMEHHQMGQMLEKLKPLLTVQELWTGIQAIEGQEIDPGALLRSHESKEHDILYPLADQILGAEQARQLIARMRTEVDKK